MKYINKPVVREAVKFNGKNFDEIREFMGGLFFHPIHNRPLISTLEGDYLVSVGDYIIKVVEGAFYPCKPDIFEMAYEPADKPDPRDELIKVYEEALGEYVGGCYDGHDYSAKEISEYAKEALAQGAEIKKRIKKRMEDDATN